MWTQLLWLLIWCFRASPVVMSEGNLVATPDINPNKNDTNTISKPVFDMLVTTSKLIDISYCISSATHLGKPFRCATSCSEFPNMMLVHQWTTRLDLDILHEEFKFSTESTKVVITGYISIDHYAKTWYVSLRGTRSPTDAIADLNVSQTPYTAFNCSDCYVHDGFSKMFQNTLLEINIIMDLLVMNYPDYQIKIMGHSAGGAVANFLALYLINTYSGFDLSIDCITFGQPKVGNSQFAEMLNFQFNITSSLSAAEYYGSQAEFQKRKLFRVTNIGDPVVQLPYSMAANNNAPDIVEYSQSKGELCITKLNTDVSPEDVLICEGPEDPMCTKLELWGSNSHLLYFKVLGYCNLGIFNL